MTPPFGLEHEGEYDVVRAGPLLDALEAAPRVAVVLVRMGGYAVGVFEGERLVASKVGTRFVKGRHKKGGSSSNRFRRRRGEQERELVDAAAAEAARVLEPWRGRVEHVALGGDRSAVTRVLESRADLAWLQPLALERFFDVPEPRLRVLEALPYQLYAAKVVEEPLARRRGGRPWRRRPSRSRGGPRADARRARPARPLAPSRFRGRG